MRLRGGESGATLVEFTIGVILLFGLTGVVIDLGFILQRYHRLTNIVADVTRQTAMSAPECPDKLSSQQDLQSRIKNELGNSPTVSYERLDSKPGYSLPALRLSAEIPANCFFCMFIPKDFKLKTSSEAIIETSAICPQ